MIVAIHILLFTLIIMNILMISLASKVQKKLNDRYAMILFARGLLYDLHAYAEAVNKITKNATIKKISEERLREIDSSIKILEKEL